MLKRVYDTNEAHKICNHPEVLPFIIINDQKNIDLTEFVKNDKNVLLVSENSCFAFESKTPGIFEAHPQFLKEARGKEALSLANEAIRYVFSKTDCIEIQANVPIKYRHSSLFVRWLGFEYITTRDMPYDMGGEPCIAKLYNLTYKEWRERWQ